MGITLTPVKNERYVARVEGVDLSKPLSEDIKNEIVAASDKFAVLVFHDQPLDNEQLVGFGATFGPLDTGLQEKLMKKVQDRYTSAAISDISNVAQSGEVAGTLS
ncbi:MAG: TauD/TfdA dioxygenase family protein, partial [Sphingomonadaceae bacterium]